MGTLNVEPLNPGWYFNTADSYVKKYEKKSKYEKIDIAACVKNSRETPHAFGMVNKFLTNTKVIRIG